MFEKKFGGESAFDLSLKWAGKIPDSKTVVLSEAALPSSALDSGGAGFEAEVLEAASVSSLLKKLSELSEREGSSSVVFSYADLPFLNTGITASLIETHSRYRAEYTFADGYPYGFSPEIIDSGTLKILHALSVENQKDAGRGEISRTCIFDFIKLDINSFEVEVEVSDEDMGLLRLSFDSGSKLDFLSCAALFDALDGKAPDSLSKKEIFDLVSKTCGVYRTVPSYYGIQLSSAANFQSIYEPSEMFSGAESFMKRSDWENLLRKISDYSFEAVINPGFFGEPLLHPDFMDFAKTVLSYPKFSLLVETDGLGVTEGMLSSIKEEASKKSVENGFGIGRVLWIVKIDCATAEKYRELHSDFDGFSSSVSAVRLINEYFPGRVYPQFVRSVKNEDELESFWRYWSSKENGSGGNVLVQKYSSFCGTLPDLKSADLSPLGRNACYHLRRDFNVLVDGSVPFCRETLRKKIIGNAFTEDLGKIFRLSDGEFSLHLKNSYCGFCGKCDEYYTFNF